MGKCENCGCPIPEGEKLCSSCQSQINSFWGNLGKGLLKVAGPLFLFFAGYKAGQNSKKKD